MASFLKVLFLIACCSSRKFVSLFSLVVTRAARLLAFATTTGGVAIPDVMQFCWALRGITTTAVGLLKAKVARGALKSFSLPYSPHERLLCMPLHTLILLFLLVFVPVLQLQALLVLLLVPCVEGIGWH